MRRLTHYILLGATTLLALSAVLTSCSDDEKFTADKGAVLAFSQDTIKFDTVFTGISSSTERLNVYNRNSEGVRISNVRLESGGTSGFKMNVDGRFGTSIDDVEILKKDSIFVFVEVNAPQQTADIPTKVSDAILFTLESGIQQKVALEAYGQNVRILRAEVIREDQTLDSTLPYLIYESLVVEENATLTISEGATLCFHNEANLFVNGRLNIEGTLENPVTLRGDRTDRMFTYLPYDRLDNQWGGVILSTSCSGCNINYADIHSGYNGITCDSIKGELNITNSVIHNVGGEGLEIVSSHALIANTQISNARGNCISIYGGTSNFYHCTVAQFCPWIADRGNALFASNYMADEEHLVEEANFYNCFITGYANDEVYGYPGEKELNIHFYNCVLLTDVTDSTYFHGCTAESKDLDRYQATNFKTVDTDTYFYDFHLDTLSTAIGKGDAKYTELYPLDRDGKQRSDSPDAGCYQWK